MRPMSQAMLECYACYSIDGAKYYFFGNRNPNHNPNRNPKPNSKPNPNPNQANLNPNPNPNGMFEIWQFLRHSF